MLFSMKTVTAVLFVCGFGLSLISPSTGVAQSQDVQAAEAAYINFVGVARSARSMRSVLPYLSQREVSRYQQSLSWESSAAAKTEKSQKKLARWRDIAMRHVRVVKATPNKKGVILKLNVQKMNKTGRYAPPKSGVKYDDATIQLVNERGYWKIDAYNDTMHYIKM